MGGGKAARAGKRDEKDPPRVVRRGDPRVGDGAVERRVRPEEVGADPEDGASQRKAVSAAHEPADDRRADGDALRHHLEYRWATGDVPVDPRGLDAAVTSRGPPLSTEPTRSPRAIKPAGAWHVGRPRIAAEQKRDVCDARGGRKDRGRNGVTARHGHPAREVG